MQPLFFGASQKQLFAVHHPAEGNSARARAVVLCYPFGQEYLRSHRSFRQLSLLLAKSGCDVLRFDYFGTGDSAGLAEEFSLQESIQNIIDASEEIREISGAASVTLVGLRLGASLALEAANRLNDGGLLEQIVLWDPITSGSAYLHEMLDEASQISSDDGEPAELARSHTIGINGFPLTPNFRDELSQIDLKRSVATKALRAFLVTSHDRNEFTDFSNILSANANLEHKQILSPGNWNDLDDYGGALLHSEIVRQIVGWVAQN